MAHMQMYKTCKLSGIEFTKSMLQMDHELTNKHLFPEDQSRPHSQPTREAEEDQLVWEGYGTRSYPSPTPLNPKAIRQVKRKAYCEHGFMETPKFWDDLLEIGSKVCKAPVDSRNR